MRLFCLQKYTLYIFHLHVGLHTTDWVSIQLKCGINLCTYCICIPTEVWFFLMKKDPGRYYRPIPKLPLSIMMLWGRTEGWSDKNIIWMLGNCFDFHQIMKLINIASYLEVKNHLVDIKRLYLSQRDMLWFGNKNDFWSLISKLFLWA